MPRYFIEVSYKGTNYSGFQKQQNANSVQAELEKALDIFYRQKFELTGSSRTDAGVHALQNFFHFDSDTVLEDGSYNLNAILPADIVCKRIFVVADNAHCRFDAISRQYHYYLYQDKNPFLQGRAYYVPYSVDMDLLQAAAAEIKNHTDFTSFSKRNTQVKTFECTIYQSEWLQENNCLVYTVKANRFLRGMVKGLVGTMLLVGKKKISLEEFTAIIESKDCTKADFSVTSDGLFLIEVAY
ncbi:MAG: tRNA pseudouridine(38-40) synthase TruA [Chitinophagaceae bacterium]|nr:tRNA pseudouridine(38-40) synthase TruA [Chitinophagaceae bacterium]MBK7309087.1 tRNA pseudouridine(38-40) synthase TruA [Chitinophagaceae bacterium]MBK8786643.1 tRNA pseudouridine(38-40) synthase TruA [Chitinophagaceae bacterium]MBK9483845.1 tRNA pseudouridine(38-40) synthase TruA [Chitinophagaceae bacterium]MBL0200592.1 tRNA pseudouridine(38-40) synthase TruA [Chitinophagaceae bacterium]